MNSNPGKAYLIVIIAIVTLTALSFVPWSRLTNGYIKDFNLFGDILKSHPSDETTAPADNLLDPDLALAIAESEVPANDSTSQISAELDTVQTPTDTIATLNNRIGDIIIFEDYTANKGGLSRFSQAVNSSGRVARIAFIGDSYIEGDIFTQNVRQLLQDRFGGAGAGYVPMSSTTEHFRTSVRVSGSGWTEHDIRTNSKKEYKWLAGLYFSANGNSTTTYSGSNKLPHLDKWQTTSLLFVSKSSGTLNITTDDGVHTFEITGSDDIQCVSVVGATAKAKISTNIVGLNAFGAYLDGSSGVAVDNMSLRGYSGIAHRYINPETIQKMRKHYDYDLIVVEYGMNAISAGQTDYSAYSAIMVKSLNQIRQCYPNADIVLMGIGDRGQKQGGEVHSLTAVPGMVKAQRQAAQQAGVLFWDTRQAMGGDDAVVEWRNKGYINADYIHLNSKGGKALADEFIKALNHLL